MNESLLFAYTKLIKQHIAEKVPKQKIRRQSGETAQSQDGSNQMDNRSNIYYYIECGMVSIIFKF